MREEKFLDVVNSLKKSSKLNAKEKQYLEERMASKEKWAKCFIKKQFVGCVSTTSRVEAFHSKLRKYFNSGSSLVNVFVGFRKIETIQLQKFKDEYSDMPKKKDQARLSS